MRVCWVLALSALMLWFAQSGYADDETRDDDYRMKDITVQARGETDDKDTVDLEILESGRNKNVGEALAETPGVSAVRRGASATEPVIRGLGWERVTTQVDGLPLHGACPARMDPPITYVRSYAPEKIMVVKGSASVTQGPAGTGGRIIIDTDYERSPDDPETLNGWLKVGGETNRDGRSAELGVKGGTKWLDVKGVIEGAGYSDYSSAEDIEVPADQEEYSGALALGIRTLENHRWSNYINYVREDGVEFPSLPMDMDESDFWVYTTGYRIRPAGGRIEEVDLSAGLQLIDHVMSNREKPNRRMVEAETPSESDAYSAGAKLTFRLSPGTSLIAGADFSQVNRDATRTRHMVMSGQTFKDRIWPDVSQSDVGGFAEVQGHIADNLDLRAGGRIDLVSSRAEAADEPSLQMQTVRQQFVRFYGAEASNVDDDETVGSGNLVLTWRPYTWMDTYIGGGITTRAAGVTERFFAFAPAPGGFLVGNPTLEPEQKLELEWGIGIQRSWFDADVAVFHHWVNDYILQTQIDSFDVNGDGSDDVIRGFRNIDARLYGFEVKLLLRAGDRWSFPITAALVRGENTTDDKDLAEIPPLEATAAVRVDLGEKIPWWVQFGGRFVDQQDKIDAAFPEDETDGFAVFHLRGGATLRDAITIELGVENLFDADYNEHLTREAFFTQGDLTAGDEVPAPGLTVYGSIRWDF